MAGGGRWMKKERLRNSGGGNGRRMTACDSEIETESWGWGADWVFAPWAQLAKGKPAQCTTCHSTFYQQHSELFLEDGSSNLTDFGLVFSSAVCTCVCSCIRASGSTQLLPRPCWNAYVSPRWPCWHLISNPYCGVLPCKCCMCVFVSIIMLRSACVREKICCMSLSSLLLSITL